MKRKLVLFALIYMAVIALVLIWANVAADRVDKKTGKSPESLQTAAETGLIGAGRAG